MSSRPLVLISPAQSLPVAAWHAVGRQVHRWAVGSQQAARRNAMLANTALAERRAERESVEEFLASRGVAPLSVPLPRTHSG